MQGVYPVEICYKTTAIYGESITNEGNDTVFSQQGEYPLIIRYQYKRKIWKGKMIKK